MGRSFGPESTLGALPSAPRPPCHDSGAWIEEAPVGGEGTLAALGTLALGLFRSALEIRAATAVLRHERGAQFDPEVVDAFFEVLRSRPWER